MRRRALALLLASSTLAACHPLLFPAQSFLDPAAAGRDYEIQGEYDGGDPRSGVQVIAVGERDFRYLVYSGGLPGAGWDGTAPLTGTGHRSRAGVVHMMGEATMTLEGDTLVGTAPGGKKIAATRIDRSSPTLGAPAPDGAIVIFGSGTNATDGEVDERGHLMAGATTERTFGDFTLHAEFRTPFTPQGGGQFRGNSGVYLQERYEVQILDSFGQPKGDRTCGALYKVSPAAVNMSFPPLRWQTYDIDFRAARYDGEGNRTEKARVTVRHNGVRIHDDVPLDGPTGQGSAESPDPGPIYFQDHNDPVVFRNIWVIPR